MGNTLTPTNLVTGVTPMGMSRFGAFGPGIGGAPDDNGSGGGSGSGGNDGGGANGSGAGSNTTGGGASGSGGGNAGGNAGGSSNGTGSGGGDETRTLTTSQINAIVEERLARDRQQRGVSDFDTYKASHEELKQLKEKDLPEADRLRAQMAEKDAAAAQATARAEAAELAQARFEVAAAKGLGLELAPRLQGSTKEELEADAEKLLAVVGTANGVATGGPRPPRPNGQQGNSSGEGGEKSISRGAALYAAAHGKNTSTTQ